MSAAESAPGKGAKFLELWETPLASREKFSSWPFEQQARYLCLLAHLAPSTHNTQPWRFWIRPSERTITLYLDRTYVLPASDREGRQATISIGCALEHLLIGSQYYGLTPVVTLASVDRSAVRPREEADASRYVEVATVRLLEDTPSEEIPEEGLVRAIFSRRVTRAEFDPTHPLPETLVEKILAGPRGSVARVHPVTSAVARRMLAELQGQADSYVINSPAFRSELAEWMLPNDIESPLGMPGAGFGLNDQEAKRIHEGLRAGSLYPEDGLKFSMAGKRGIESSPFLGLLTAPREGVAEWLDAGRTLAYALLLVESAGFQAAVHAGIAEVPLIRHMFRAFGLEGPLLGTFRAGRVRDPQHAQRPHSPRQPLDRVLLWEPPQR
ncbi:MAG: hypothetical protein KatS3mg115_0726 [Candidatus Poribacteria bacterium]|nr:MAG: hypothetical protein KatS3mg115_0726 [Candidatus Poribacteria bacterium]